MSDVKELLRGIEDQPIFDEPALREITEAAGMAPMELLDMFFEDSESNLRLMAQVLAEGDREVFNRSAHSMKSSAGNVGAQRLAQVAQALEKQTKLAFADDTPELFEQFKARYREFSVVIGEKKESLLV